MAQTEGAAGGGAKSSDEMIQELLEMEVEGTPPAEAEETPGIETEQEGETEETPVPYVAPGMLIPRDPKFPQHLWGQPLERLVDERNSAVTERHIAGREKNDYAARLAVYEALLPTLGIGGGQPQPEPKPGRGGRALFEAVGVDPNDVVVRPEEVIGKPIEALREETETQLERLRQDQTALRREIQMRQANDARLQARGWLVSQGYPEETVAQLEEIAWNQLKAYRVDPRDPSHWVGTVQYLAERTGITPRQPGEEAETPLAGVTPVRTTRPPVASPSTRKAVVTAAANPKAKPRLAATIRDQIAELAKHMDVKDIDALEQEVMQDIASGKVRF